jgi:hypothetical protein
MIYLLESREGGHRKNELSMKDMIMRKDAGRLPEVSECNATLRSRESQP